MAHLYAGESSDLLAYKILVYVYQAFGGYDASVER